MITLWLLLLFLPTKILAEEPITISKENFAMPDLSETSYLNNRSIAIAFDLHGVLFTFDYGGAASLALSYGTLVTLAQRLFGFKGLFTTLAPLLLPLTYGIVTYGWLFWQQGFAPTVEHHIFGGNRYLAWILKKIWLWLSSFYLPRTDLIDLAWSLKHKGYTLILASNIGPLALEELKNNYPYVFSRDGIDLFDSIWQPNAETLWTTKPHFDFFIDLKEHCLKKWPKLKTLLFIDNKRKNIRHAEKSDNENFYISILFSKTSKLKNDLKSLKII